MPEPLFAAIFDWDGVIINSEEFHRLGWERLAEESGLALPEGHGRLGTAPERYVVFEDGFAGLNANES